MMKLTSAFAIGFAAAPALSSAETLTLATFIPPAHVQSVHGVDPFMACVTERTGGEIDFNYFPSAQIASVGNSLEALHNGIADIAWLATAFLSDTMRLNQMTMLPDMADSSAQAAKAYRQLIDDNSLMAQELLAADVTPLFISINPPYRVGSRNGPVTTVADFDGMKVRVAAGAQVFTAQSLNASPVQMPGGDSYLAMQQGTVDGYFFPLTSVDSYSLNEVSGSISLNGNFATAQSFVAINSDRFNALPAGQQEALIGCGVEVEASLAEFMDSYTLELQDKFASEGVEIYEIPETDLAEMYSRMESAATAYIERMDDLGLPGQQAYDEYRAALGK